MLVYTWGWSQPYPRLTSHVVQGLVSHLFWSLPTSELYSKILYFSVFKKLSNQKSKYQNRNHQVGYWLGIFEVSIKLFQKHDIISPWHGVHALCNLYFKKLNMDYIFISKSFVYFWTVGENNFWFPGLLGFSSVYSWMYCEKVCLW